MNRLWVLILKHSQCCQEDTWDASHHGSHYDWDMAKLQEQRGGKNQEGFSEAVFCNLASANANKNQYLPPSKNKKFKNNKKEKKCFLEAVYNPNIPTQCLTFNPLIPELTSPNQTLCVGMNPRLQARPPLLLCMDFASLTLCARVPTYQNVFPS